MRNDVKLGFAIGGVLLAVLIVYVLVVPGGSNTQRQTKLDNTSKPGGKVTLEPVPATQAYAPPTAPPGSFTPPTTAGETVTQVAAGEEETPEPAAPAKAKDFDWNKVLNTSPVLMTTPQVGGETQVAQGGEGRGSSGIIPPTPARVPPLEPERTTIAAHEPTQFSNGPATRPSNLTQAPSFSARTHVVQANETLSSISAAAYGNQNYWPAIVKANPGLDPNRMKVGTTLKLPDLKDVKPADPQSAAGRVGPGASTPIDASKQYRVESGDNLSNIALKLYGKSTWSNRIYELNKQMIGNDPAKLKVGQVLQLPEPPTVHAR